MTFTPSPNDYRSFGFKLTADGAQYKLWKQIMDANIKAWIYNTCDHHLLQILFKQNCTAQQLLDTIDDFFVNNKRSRCFQIREIFRTVKKGDMNVTDFCYTLKNLYDVLNDADNDSGTSVSETELVMQILRQLPPSYDEIVDTIANTKPFPSFCETKDMLVGHELRETYTKHVFETLQKTNSDLSQRNDNRRRKQKQNGKKKMGCGAPEGGSNILPPSLPPDEHGPPMLAAAGFGGQQPSQHAQHFRPQSYQFGQHQFWQPSPEAYSTSPSTNIRISPASLQPPNKDSKYNMDTASTSHIIDESKKTMVGNSDVLPVTHTDTTELTFQGHIVYSRTFSEVEKATDDLLKFVETKYKDGGRAVIGLDIEWKPSFRKGQKESKAAVLQICADSTSCHVMHIMHSGFPQNLQNLLSDTTFLKVGVGIAKDARKVFNDHNVSVEALQDLSRLANQKFGGKPKMWGLSSLTEKLTCKQIPKPKKIKLGNWEANPLSRKQLEYAATDAYVSLLLFEVLNRLPDAADTLTNEAVEAIAPS